MAHNDPHFGKSYDKVKALMSLNQTIDESKLNDEEKWKLDHLRMHEKHKGHDAMHAEMIVILFVTLAVAQFVLVQWKHRHFKSYQVRDSVASYDDAFDMTIQYVIRDKYGEHYTTCNKYQRVTLLCMWLIPAIISIFYKWPRFFIIWSVFSLIVCYVWFRASRKPMEMTTPRLVYKFFYFVYRLTYGIGLFGYTVVMGTLFGINVLLMIKPQTSMDFGLLLLFYGLYFGVVSRDLAEVCSEKLASQIGYFTKTGLPSRKLEDGVCAVCANEIIQTNDDEDESVESSFKLSCGHLFHEFCIRGWCIVGKRQTCPYCKEKVDLKRMFPSPWERPHLMYGNLLDWIRYLVAWQPVIIVIVQLINKGLGLE